MAPSFVILLVSILAIGWLIGALIVWACGDPKSLYAHKKTVEALRAEQRAQEAIEKDAQALTAEQRAQEEAIQVIRKHVETLYIKQLQKRKRDDYGNIIDAQWVEEMDYFYDNVILLALGSRDEKGFNPLSPIKTATDIETLPRHMTLQLIEKEISVYASRPSRSDREVATMSPVAFEAYCAQLLNNTGWQATTTKGSGDQGIDIVATKNGVKAVFQCKKYASPVGNRAVQEIIAGKSYSAADHAFVVSNADFTPAARELAQKTGVHLIHYLNLSDLSRYIGM